MSSLDLSLYAVIALIALALVFDFLNGFHDAANAIATVVSTSVLKPGQAVMLAAVCNLLALGIFGTHVAATIGKGTVDPLVVDHFVLCGALIGAVCWNIITWYFGIPSSSSHALIGGIVGATLMKSGPAPLIWSGIGKTILFIIVSPILGMILGALMMLLVSRLFFHSTPTRVDRWFRRLQLLSAGAYSLGHGGNDAQKTIGIIWLLLISSGYLNVSATHPPLWVIFCCYSAISLGTLLGGWRIVKTLGQGITKLKPAGGFCAETGGAITLFLASALGIPVSTTHTITGAIVGVGSAQRFSAVRWGLATSIIWAWILTIPCSALIAAGAWWISHQLF